MDVVQVVRRVVDQQVRPGQRASAVMGGAEVTRVAARSGEARFLVKVAASGEVMEYGTYGRGSYGRHRYGGSTSNGG